MFDLPQNPYQIGTQANDFVTWREGAKAAHLNALKQIRDRIANFTPESIIIEVGNLEAELEAEIIKLEAEDGKS